MGEGEGERITKQGQYVKKMRRVKHKVFHRDLAWIHSNV
jgi:hypothetical protein